MGNCLISTNFREDKFSRCVLPVGPGTESEPEHDTVEFDLEQVCHYSRDQLLRFCPPIQPPVALFDRIVASPPVDEAAHLDLSDIMLIYNNYIVVCLQKQFFQFYNFD